MCFMFFSESVLDIFKTRERGLKWLETDFLKGEIVEWKGSFVSRLPTTGAGGGLGWGGKGEGRLLASLAGKGGGGGGTHLLPGDKGNAGRQLRFPYKNTCRGMEASTRKEKEKGSSKVVFVFRS